MKPLTIRQHLNMAQSYANDLSGCNKVSVGSVIAKDDVIVSLGANRSLPDVCKSPCGCLRVSKYGDDSKSHRDPADCRAIHSEVDAICRAAKAGHATEGASIFVTRYPCESCAKAIVAAGIKDVYYGGTSRISSLTEEIFATYGISCYFIKDWKEDNTDR